MCFHSLVHRTVESSLAVKYTVGGQNIFFLTSLTMMVVNALKIALLCLSSIGASISSASVQEPEIHVRGLRNHVAVASQTEEGENIDINHRVSTYYFHPGTVRIYCTVLYCMVLLCQHDIDLTDHFTHSIHIYIIHLHDIIYRD